MREHTNPQPPKHRLHCALVPVLMLLITAAAYSAVGRDRFAITTRDVDLKDLSPLDQGYGWGFGKLGFFINGHGLPDQHSTIVIVHKSAAGKAQLIWPDFVYGNDQANAAVLGGIIVFIAGLPDGQTVLMAHRLGEPPMVISPAALRLAAHRLGTTIIVPETDYSFIKVRLPPGRIWLEGAELSTLNGFEAKTFSVELTSDDLIKIMDETRRRGKKNKARKFEYVAEGGSALRIDVNGLKEIESVKVKAKDEFLTPKNHQGTTYVLEQEQLYGRGLVDPINHYAYFSTFHEPGRILKVALNADPKKPPTVVGAAVLEPEEDKTFDGVIDPQDGHAYFGTDFPGHVVKIALGARNEPPYRVGSVLLNKQERVRVGVVSPATGYGCFSARNKLYKIKLGEADEAPSLVASIELQKDAFNLVSAVYDPTTQCAYFGSEGAKIYKVAVGEGDSPLRLVGELALLEGESGLRGALIDPQTGCAWFASNNGSLVKVSLGEKESPPQRLGSLKLGYRYRYLEHTFGMDNGGYAYFGTVSSQNSDGAVIKVALGKKEELPRYVSSLLFNSDPYFATGIVDPTNRVLCLGIGSFHCSLVKLGLGEGDAPPKILGSTQLYTK